MRGGAQVWRGHSGRVLAQPSGKPSWSRRLVGEASQGD